MAALLASACGGGGGGGGGVNSTPAPTPTPVPAVAPTPSPAPSPTPTPAAVFDTSEYRRSTGPSFHNAIPAWQQGATGQGITIAVIDSGIDVGNPELAGRISGASADLAGSRGLQSDDFHGPLVALVAAAARNGSGMMGVAWQADVMALRADTPGSCATSEGCSFSSTAIAAGIDRAVSNGAKVINLSLGGSDPGNGVRAAITRAANAGVVVIVAAGNEGASQANPEGFAVALRQAGNGNVIIAGSVDDEGTISSFSNRAGNESASFLAALGEGICCLYENGAIKVTTVNGQQLTTVGSGTSFSTPQIAGAAALLRQAFPNLSAAQVVSLLLTTARDAGTSGVDTIYGRGILDIANAFAPQGATSLAGTTSQMPLGATSAVTSPAMGDAVQGASARTVVLDGYQRAYRVDLAMGLHMAQLAPRLAPALGARSFAGGAGPVSIAYSIDSRARATGSRWQGQLRLGPQEVEGARVLAARVAARIAPGTSLAFAFAQGADGLAAQVRGAGGPAFLVAGSPLDDTGFSRTDQFSLALRRQFGGWGLTLSAESGKAAASAPERIVESLGARRRRDAVTRVGLSLDRDWGPVDAALTASWLAEDSTVLGARFNDALGAGGANSLVLDAAAGWRPAEGWRIGAAWRQAYTRARRAGLVAQGSRLSSNGWAFDVARNSLFQPGDSLALRVSQPLRVQSGGIGLMLPVSWDYQTLTAENSLRRISLAPKGREIATELVWRGSLGNGTASASLFYRKDPGHYASLPDDKGVAVTWSTGF